ncbi:MAG TPA: Hint domain-containing protein [Bradyrhizobium sp.]
MAATVFVVNTTTDTDPDPGHDLTLSEAIADANANSNPDGSTIEFDPSVFTAGNDTYTLGNNGANLPAIAADVTIDGTTSDGKGITLVGGGLYQGLFVHSGTVSIDNLTITDAVATGDNGEAAQRASIGGETEGGGGGGGGGAGLGGGLFVATGADVTLSNVAFKNDSAKGGSGGDGAIGAAGQGGDGGASPGSSTHGASGGEGGTKGFGGLVGFDGTFGGGGGGGGSGSGLGKGATGGAGGFGGGGGGGGGSFGGPGPNGAGGFGGGNGGSALDFTGGGGGGGLGAGGDIFVEQGGSLTIDAGSLGAATVTGGTGAGNAADGHGYGSGLFIEGGTTAAPATITFAPAANTTETISGVIADMTGSNDPSGQQGVGALIMDGAGKLVLGADNTPGSSSDPEHAGFTGGITIENGTVDLAAAGAAGSGAITFSNAPAVDSTLQFTAADAPTNAIKDFGAGDLIVIDNYAVTGEAYSNGVLELTEAGGPTIDLKISGPGISGISNFHFSVDATNDTTTIAFYCRGTLISTETAEVAVEHLVIGDKVATASGALRPIKWIGRRSYGGRFIMGRTDILPICFKAGSLADNVPRRDLWISPHHAMYFKDKNPDGVLIEARDLVNGASIVQAERVDELEYFHIELESHDVIVAEGALSETFLDDDSRGMFHNAHEYAARYPDAQELPARYCAPRCADGYEVERVRQRIALRAGTRHDEPHVGALRGCVDIADAGGIVGWAQNIDHPETPVCLDIYADGRLIGQALANRYREDLKQAGLGSGCHSFTFKTPTGFAFARAALEVRRSLDGASLEFSTEARKRIAG